MLSFIRRIWNDQGSQSLMEYTPMLALIRFAIVGLAKVYHGGIA